MNTLINSLNDLKYDLTKHFILLYSGGLDGMYFLDWALKHGCQPIALYVQVAEDEDPWRKTNAAREMGVEVAIDDRRDELVRDFIKKGLHANARYQGTFPVASTLTRPLLAKAAVELAQKRGYSAVAHTATYMQNSATRFHLALAALAPELKIIAPFLRSQVPRDEKLAAAERLGMKTESGIYSVDNNLWARVIECGTLENPENDLPNQGVFIWTRDYGDTPDSPDIVEVEFEKGMPVAIEGRHMALRQIIQDLNARGGQHGVGRHVGLEETAFGVKNHEIREAPAAEILLTAHHELEMAALTSHELTLKSHLEREWTNIAVRGEWFSDLAEALLLFLQRMSQLAHGHVRLLLSKGQITVLSKRADHGLYYAGFEHDYAATMEKYNFEAGLALMSLPGQRRAKLRNLTSEAYAPLSARTSHIGTRD
jgi:argininosuccinate synthase